MAAIKDKSLLKNKAVNEYFNDSDIVFTNANLLKNAGANRLTVLIYKRAQKIKIALLLISDLGDNEEFKRLSEIAESFLSKIIDLLSGTNGYKKLFPLILADSLKVFEVLDHLYFKGVLNNNNLRVVKKAISSLLDLISENASALFYGDIVFNDYDFNANSLDLKTEDRAGIKDNLNTDKGHLKDIENTIKDKKETIKDKVDKSREIKRLPSLNSLNNSRSRRMQIIDLLQMHSSLSLKDISAQFPDWSSKTIQRELSSMCKDGVLEKEGEKRWTRYSLATSS